LKPLVTENYPSTQIRTKSTVFSPKFESGKHENPNKLVNEVFASTTYPITTQNSQNTQLSREDAFERAGLRI
jgi:hypothetical protein